MFDIPNRQISIVAFCDLSTVCGVTQGLRCMACHCA
ncbi:Uncharacterised protein [Vibrio cholerae]|nr:Uncharacterised protein [Vibrio cholerae]